MEVIRDFAAVFMVEFFVSHLLFPLPQNGKNQDFNEVPVLSGENPIFLSIPLATTRRT
jgi:hypothetical protein